MKGFGIWFTFGIALSSAMPAFAQTKSEDVAAAAAPIAYVYVGTAKGVDLYDAASNGQLTLVKGSPFKTSGLAIGSNGSSFITLGTYDVHSYTVSSTGTIGKQASSINTQDYPDDGNCGGQSFGTEGLANLDHTGKNLYVLFPNDNGDCSEAVQTYNISKSGDLSFNGGIMTGSNAGYGFYQAPTIIGNDTFAYAAGDFECCGGGPSWEGYVRESSGEMQNLTFNLSGGNTFPLGYVPYYVTADATNHLAAIVANNYGPEEYDPAQLASFTVDSKGNISSTATAKNMPYPKVNDAYTLNMSPSGKLLAVGGYGLQVFHFNGAAPITPYSKVLTGAAITQMHWDNNNHLYALSAAQTSSTLSYSASNATDVTIKGSDGSSYPVGDCSGECEGEQVVSPTATTKYTISGTKIGGGKTSAVATVTVYSKPAAKDANPSSEASSEPALSISAYPTSITTYSRLFVYTVTPTTVSEAPGSPYTLSSPGVDALIVVPKL
jgi:hypothetical protein